MMICSPGGLLRLAARMAVGIGTLAILLGRSQPRPAACPPLLRPGVPRRVPIDCASYPGTLGSTCILDTQTGEVAPLEFPGEGHITPLGGSPWSDAAGSSHLIGSWLGGRSKPFLGPYGLARYTFPGGRVLERFDCDPMPIGRVCWSPGRSDCILFAAGDGRFYRGEMPGEQGAGASLIRGRPIAWHSTPDADGVSSISDLCWSSDPAGDGCLFAAVVPRRKDASGIFPGPHLWWLQLGAGGAKVVAGGRLITPDLSVAHAEERLPAVGVTADGRPLLAYLAREDGQETWDLWLAPLEHGPAGEAPPVRSWSAAGRKLALGCLCLPPAFSPDGRWVHAWRRDVRAGVRVERLAVDAPTESPPAGVAREGIMVLTRREPGG
jgi:hypothetical protein